RSTISSTEAPTSRLPFPATTLPLPTAPAAPIRRRSRRCSPGGSSSRTRREAQPRRPAPRSSTASPSWAPARALSTCSTSVKLSELGELGLLAELERRGLARGIEDDSAEVEGLVVTQDSLVEGTHFRLDWISHRDLGFRAAAVN